MGQGGKEAGKEALTVHRFRAGDDKQTEFERVSRRARKEEKVENAEKN
jgi:hypothetical protein